jgi:hypothetical protein
MKYEPREDGKCCRCNSSDAVTNDGRFCRRCLADTVLKSSTPVVREYTDSVWGQKALEEKRERRQGEEEAARLALVWAESPNTVRRFHDFYDGSSFSVSRSSQGREDEEAAREWMMEDTCAPVDCLSLTGCD